MYSQFSLVRFSSVALVTTSSKMFDWARNMASAWSWMWGAPRGCGGEKRQIPVDVMSAEYL
jgi:hypothetical protein